MKRLNGIIITGLFLAACISSCKKDNPPAPADPVTHRDDADKLVGVYNVIESYESDIMPSMLPKFYTAVVTKVNDTTILITDSTYNPGSFYMHWAGRIAVNFSKKSLKAHPLNINGDIKDENYWEIHYIAGSFPSMYAVRQVFNRR